MVECRKEPGWAKRRVQRVEIEAVVSVEHGEIVQRHLQLLIRWNLRHDLVRHRRHHRDHGHRWSRRNIRCRCGGRRLNLQCSLRCCRVRWLSYHRRCRNCRLHLDRLGGSSGQCSSYWGCHRSTSVHGHAIRRRHRHGRPCWSGRRTSRRRLPRGGVLHHTNTHILSDSCPSSPIATCVSEAHHPHRILGEQLQRRVQVLAHTARHAPNFARCTLTS